MVHKASPLVSARLTKSLCLRLLLGRVWWSEPRKPSSAAPRGRSWRAEELGGGGGGEKGGGRAGEAEGRGAAGRAAKGSRSARNAARGGRQVGVKGLGGTRSGRRSHRGGVPQRDRT